MGQVDDGLHAALERRGAHFVEQQSQDDRHRKAERELIEPDQQGVAEDQREVARLQQPLEVFQSDPGAAQDSLDRREVLEGDDDAVHRQVLEQEVEQNAGNQQQVEVAVLDDVRHQGGALRESWRRCLNPRGHAATLR